MDAPIVFHGRNASIMALVHHQLRSAGLHAEGFTDDDRLFSRLQASPPALVIVGAGIEDAPRERVRALCAARGIRLLEHYGGADQLVESIRRSLSEG